MRAKVVCIVMFLALTIVPSAYAQQGDDQPTEPGWWQWKERIDSFFEPLFSAMIDARDAMDGKEAEMCGNLNETFTPGADPLAPITISEDPSMREMAWTFGQSLGRPVGYIRALQASNNIGLSFVNVLFWGALGGVSWIVFILTISLLIRGVRVVVDFVVEVYKLIPFKAA